MARKILLADDSVTAQNMGRKILMEAGYEVTTVNNGSAALKRINELKPDLIVLDVYMPGYGGLEVCHRLKENPETARIPVLLTVGKLEPFKVEEARRVRADMHIVKPFEASELLTALTKLEDKIVAQSDMPKKGKFSKSGLAEPAPADTFGDEQSGWKSRLIAPKKKAKAEKVEPKPEPKPAREYTTEEGSEAETISSTDWRSLLSASVAEDSRPEAKAEDKPVVAKDKVSSEEESKPADSESVAAEVLRKAQEAVAAENATEIKNAPEPVVAKEAEETQPEVKAPVLETKPAVDEFEKEVAASDKDVADALASLVPAQSSAGDRELVSAASFQSSTASGPRWVAQSVLVSEEESQSLLEHEMERAYAQLTAPESVVSFAMGPLDAMSFSSASSEPSGRDHQKEIHDRAATHDPEPSVEAISEKAHVPSPEVTSGEAEAPSASPEPVSEIQAAEPSVAPVEAVSAESVAPETKEHNVELQTESKVEENKIEENKVEEKKIQEHHDAPRPSGSLWLSAPPAYVAATSVSKIAKEEAPVATPEPAPEAAPQQAFAAAAGSDVSTPVAIEAPATAPAPETAQPESAKKESELAAAWQSWRQIREVDAKAAPAQPSEPEKLPKFKNPANWREEMAPEAAKAESEEDSHGEEISSLVDTMLAELKPKLMKEIAKKMGKEKEKK